MTAGLNNKVKRKMKHMTNTHTNLLSYLFRYCSKMEQLFLQAVAAEIQRTGVEETIFEKVYVQLKTLCIFDGK
jgi:hypothetical protein